MSRVIEITYGRTFNDGNFEASRIDLKVELGLNESYDDGFKFLLNTMNELREKELDYTPPVKEPVRRRRP